jgi:hypothetical protein
MRYLCLVYIDERTFDGMSQAELDGMVNDRRVRVFAQPGMGISVTARR